MVGLDFPDRWTILGAEISKNYNYKNSSGNRFMVEKSKILHLRMVQWSEILVVR